MRVDNLTSLLGGIKTFVEDDDVENLTAEVNDKSLASYLQNIALLTDLDDESKSGDYVTLMSVHSAKGLEFSSVFLVGLEEKLFPSFMALESPEGLDEERRLFYVAITRAEKYLTLSYASSRYRYGNMRYNEVSRFLEEIPRDHVESSSAVRSRFSREEHRAGPPSATVRGSFKERTDARTASLKVDPDTFKPNPSSEIQTGMKVLHLKFGEGKVLSIDGSTENRIATIFFKEIDNSERRIMLKFAKLQILD